MIIIVRILASGIGSMFHIPSNPDIVIRNTIANIPKIILIYLLFVS